MNRTMKTPRLEIDLSKLAHNVRKITKIFGSRGIRIAGVTKGVCGDPKIARVFLDNGIDMLADSRLANLEKLRRAGIKAPLLLLRLPHLSAAEAIVMTSDISLNTEISVIKELSKFARKNDTRHKVILMVELGDLREGIMPDELEPTVEQVLNLEGIELYGIGSNLACFGGIIPDDKNMSDLSDLARRIEAKFHIALPYVSVGNSVVYSWIKKALNAKKINHARLGESILLGGRDLPEKEIPELYLDVFTLVAEVIEAKTKPSIPWGEVFVDAFGNVPEFQDKGLIDRVILNIGRQDVSVPDLLPRMDIEIIGASSDHLIVDSKNTKLQIGDEVAFDLFYGALLSSMTSPYVWKRYLTE
ncbi:MAG: alanine/ornithine racemase family PLP-dependent enzyme [Candidatus Aminicenantes bacterium]|nr:alanine/ornithine racemase family PLP-dependent enzyme [Candidatus Aminicenantes bacterium]